MTDEPTPHDQSEASALDRLLARADVWPDPPAGLDDSIVAAIAAEAEPRPIAATQTEAPAPTAARRRNTWWLAAAAVVAIVVVGVVLTSRGGGLTGEINVALAATEAADGATGEAVLSSTPAGLKILLEADGLPPAPEGHYYECWISNGEIRVSAGTFHFRRGHGTIELWAGVVDSSFDTIGITLEPTDGNTDSSGDVRLRGNYRLDDD